MSLVLAEVAKSIKNAVVHKKFRRKERINYMFEEILEDNSTRNTIGG
jgi:trehalose-6-phosphate synthase